MSVLAEQAVPAPRAPRREQALILEVADLRDRDVRELRLQTAADGADRQQPRRLRAAGVVVATLIGRGRRAGTCRSAARRRRSSGARSIRRRFRNVPLRLPRSSIMKLPAALRDDCVLARDGDVVEEDVAVGRAADLVRSPLQRECLARAAAAGADDERRPLDSFDAGRAAPRRAGRAMKLSVVSLVGILVLEQRATARAVVGGFGVLEPALGAVDVAHSVSAGGLARRGSRSGGRRRPARARSSACLRLQPRDELGAQDVDLSVQHSPP